MRLPDVIRCCLVSLLTAGLSSAAMGADTPDLVAHHGFETCWSGAQTVSSFAAELNAAAEGYPACIAASSGTNPTCNDSLCNGAPGCPMTLRSGSVMPADPFASQGMAQLNTTVGIDPLVIDAVAFGSHCIVTISDTSTLVAQSQLQFPIGSDGNFGLYVNSPLAVNNTFISGLASSDYTVGGDILCFIAGSLIPASSIEATLANAIEGALHEVQSVGVGETICPYPP